MSPRGRFGCLGYGCIIAVILIVLSGGGILWLVRSGIRNAVLSFTTINPVVVASPSVSPSEERGSAERLKALGALILTPRGEGLVKLTGADLNTAIKQMGVSGRVSARVQGDAIDLEFSLPLTALGAWQGARVAGFGDLLQRYLSGTLSSHVEVLDGAPKIQLRALTLNGSVFDDDALKSASEWLTGFSASLAKGEEHQIKVSRITSLKVSDGEILVTLRSE